MSNTRDKVKQFHKAFEVVDGEQPCVPQPKRSRHYTIGTARSHLLSALACFRDAAGDDLRALRLALITEELAELADASMQESATGALDALCDLQYVLDGTVLAYGMDSVADEAFDRVHTSNMTKLGVDGKPVRDKTGKVCKGPNYVPVNLKDLVK